jgi:hypothetical protein
MRDMGNLKVTVQNLNGFLRLEGGGEMRNEGKGRGEGEKGGKREGEREEEKKWGECTPAEIVSFTKSRRTSFHSKSSRMRVRVGATGTSVFEKWSYSIVTTSPLMGSSSVDIWGCTSCSLAPLGLRRGKFLSVCHL